VTPLEITGTAFISLGCLTMLLGAVGVVRFPDFYTRLHAAGTGDTLGEGFVLLGLLFVTGFSIVGLKLTLIVFFIFILNSTSTHALARAAWFAGLKPWSTSWGPLEVQEEGALRPADRDALFVPVLPADANEELAAEAEAEADAHPETGPEAEGGA